MARVLIVSNRSPVTARVEDGKLWIERSTGGLATGLSGPHERTGGPWVGWTGLTADTETEHGEELARQLSALRVVPVPLSAEEVERYYVGVCNGIIWPLFHYLVDAVPLEFKDFDAYATVNERFAEVAAAHYRPGDLVWVHDYQLMLVPALLRARLPEARIGFFLHIPFPSSELFRILPYRERLLEGLLGADLLGFHTPSYMRHFCSSALRLLGASTEVDQLSWDGRRVRVGVFPMGIDAEAYGTMAEDPAVLAQVEQFRSPDGGQILVGIDRLDYTKGIPRRLLAFERLLQGHPDLHGRVRLVQVAVPSRSGVEAYQAFREQVDGLIGRIHGAFATPTWTPIHYLFRGLSAPEITALYRAADVALVTPIRDGMNLVAKEFVASRVDEDGVLVLSEFAGAASELAEALQVNPYDVDGMADSYYRALTMPSAERRTRMRALRRRVVAHDVHRWVHTFLQGLETVPGLVVRVGVSPPGLIETAARRLREAEYLVMLLDYDGTLRSFVETPELALPDPPLLSLLRRLAARPRTDVHVISGRTRDTLERWLGDLPIGLHAEHGVWSRHRRDGAWTSLALSDTSWRDSVRRILADFAARTPGTLIEEKTASIAWHYRMAEPDFGAAQANELRLHLTALLSNEPVEILPGNKVIEVRPHGVHKGRVVEPILSSAPPGATVVAMGDDATDEDLFAALPPDALAIHVGRGPTPAPLRIADVRAVRAFLESLLTPGAGT